MYSWKPRENRKDSQRDKLARKNCSAIIFICWLESNNIRMINACLLLLKAKRSRQLYWSGNLKLNIKFNVNLDGY